MTEERWSTEPGCELNGAGDHVGHDERSGNGMSSGPRSATGVWGWDARGAERSRRASGLLELTVRAGRRVSGAGGLALRSEEGPGAVLSHANGGVLPVGWAGKPWTRVPAATGQG